MSNANKHATSRSLLLPSLATSVLLGMAPALAHAEESLCDSEWGAKSLTIEIGERKNDGQPLQSYNPAKPFEPYDLLGDRYLFAEKGVVYRTVGTFTDRKEGEEALKTVYMEMTHLYTGAYKPYLTSLGPYLVNDASTCKVNRDNPVIDPASWIMEKNKVLLVGQATTACERGQTTKKLTVVSCDGKKNLLTDSVSAPCEAGRITTCIHPLAPGVFIFEHYYSAPGAGTSVNLRVYDTAKKKKLKALSWVNEGGPEAEVLGVEDVDKDGVPEIVRSIAGSGRPTSLLKWNNGKLTEVKAP
ncbi:hypothetical protein CYFUS_007808 [Cystobacter fuscus]|uniref:Lipoprotein n=1 Tax=Cystobacter fuscus TaxID=43 RepID=A0A250JFE9_9BACT|nr:hypothetical protein [Cystobacter fuscus]ATB42330.1 hypothetical protein CYFUS_007808 [Cystobacter fuscus]